MSRRVVFFPPLDPARLGAARHAVGATLDLVNAPDEAAALAAIDAADGFVGLITPELLARAPRLLWVQAPTAGLESYVFPALVDHPAVLTNMAGLFESTAADHVMALILAFARNLHVYVRRQRERRWEPVGGEAARGDAAYGPAHVGPIDRAMRELSASTLLVVGYGSIGRAVAERAACHGMRVLAVDPVSRAEGKDAACATACAEQAGAKAALHGARDTLAAPTRAAAEAVEVTAPSRLDELLPFADFIVIACPETSETRGLFDRRRFRLMRTDAVVVNVGRGAVVRLDGLVAALEAGEIGGAALDVFETEPLPADHPLWAREDVIVTPHVAGYGPGVAARHLDLLLDNLRRFGAGRPLRNVVDKRAGY